MSGSYSLENSKPTATSKRKTFIDSNSSFIDFVVLESEIYTKEGRELAATYDPYSERKIKKPTSYYETWIHMLKGSVGAGMLAVPQAMYHAGVVPGVIGMMLLATVFTYGMHVMLKTQYIQCKRLQVPFLTLQRSMSIALKNGPKALTKISGVASIVVDFFLVSYQTGICTAYVIFIASSIKQLVEPALIEGLDIRLYMAMIFIPMVLIICIRDLKKLSLVSLVANILVIVAVLGIFYNIFFVGPFKADEVNLVSSVKTWPLFIGTGLFALDAVGVIIILEHNMKKPQHFLGMRGIFPWSMVVIVSLYIAIGLLGYLKYGRDIKETIIASLPNDNWLAALVEGIYALCIYGTYPLQCYVSLEILWGNYLVHYIKDPSKECCIEYTMRTIVVIITFILAMVIPYIDIVISLLGAFCISTLGIIFPFLLELCTLWPDQLGSYHWILVKDILFMILGFFILVIGTYVSLYTLIEK